MSTPLAYVLGRLIFDLDRAADQLLQRHLDISYRRFIFLTVLKESGTVTQHQLAVALGYSDPAVSVMLAELSKSGHVHTERSQEHARKRLVTLTPAGREVVERGRQLLDEHFDRVLSIAGIDAQHYRELAERLHQALITKIGEEQ